MVTGRQDAEDPASASPYRHDNWWFDEHGHEADPDDSSVDEESGSSTASPTRDPPARARQVAFEELATLARTVCRRSKQEDDVAIELSEPKVYLPKQQPVGDRLEEYRQHQHPRRVNEETGDIAGETTGTAIAGLQKETYIQAVDNVLARVGVTAADVDAWRRHAERLWHDPTCDPVRALTLFVTHKRKYDRGEWTTVPSRTE